MRTAWFSPFPPVRTGIAGRSAELVAALRDRGHDIDEYPEHRAHDFPWWHRRRPYDLVVYQFGNSSHHDYEWPYALRWPGMVVLHDAHLHHARAALLLREKRIDDYRAEFRRSHPHVSPDAAEIAIAGFDSALYYRWPATRSLIAASRLTAVHGHGARQALIEDMLSPPNSATPNSPTPNSQTPNPPTLKSQAPNSQGEAAEVAAKIVSIRLGEGELVSPEREARARRDVRAKYGIETDAILFGCFGGLTPEKRIPQILAALAATVPYAPSARLLLAGARAAHYDAAADAAAHGVSDRVVFTGYLEDDEALTDHIAACDVSLNLRWPTARETSGPWLRALAAGRATVITDLVHLTDVPSLDPRTWRVQDSRASRLPADASTIAIDLLDEDHSLRLAMRRLATDADLRVSLGRAAREYWRTEHSPDVMVADYERVMQAAADAPEANGAGTSGDEKLRDLLTPFGLESPV